MTSLHQLNILGFTLFLHINIVHLCMFSTFDEEVVIVHDILIFSVKY